MPPIQPTMSSNPPRPWVRLACLLGLAAGIGTQAQAQAQAQTQSGVTVYGQTDLSIRYTDNDDASRDNTWRLGPSGLFGSYLGFKGEEQLSGGNRAFFQLENGFRADTGGLTAQSPGHQRVNLFGRQSFMGLRGDWGQLSMGRQYNALISLYAFLPIGDQLYVSGDHFFSGARLNNSIVYQHKHGNWHWRADLGLGESASGVTRRATLGGSLGYGDGPFKTSLAYLQNRSQDGSTLGRYGNAGASWQVTPDWRLSGGYAHSRESGNTHRHRDIAFVSVGHKLTAQSSLYANYFVYRQSRCQGRCQKRPGDPDNVSGGIDNSFSGYTRATIPGRAQVIVLLAAHELSRRTTVYLGSDLLLARDGAAHDQLYAQNSLDSSRNSLRQSNFMLGMRHAF